MYNLIVNKDKPGADRLTKLFANYVSNPNNLSALYYVFYNKIDNGNKDLFDGLAITKEMKQIIEFGILNKNGVLTISEDKRDVNGDVTKGVELRLPNPNFVLMTTLVKLAPNYQNIKFYQDILKDINDKNLLIEYSCE